MYHESELSLLPRFFHILPLTAATSPSDDTFHHFPPPKPSSLSTQTWPFAWPWSGKTHRHGTSECRASRASLWRRSSVPWQLRLGFVWDPSLRRFYGGCVGDTASVWCRRVASEDLVTEHQMDWKLGPGCLRRPHPKSTQKSPKHELSGTGRLAAPFPMLGI